MPLPLPSPRCLRAFTLVELMIAVAVLAVLVALAAPSFQYVNNSSRLSGMANEMLASLQLARSEAIRRGVRTVVCPSADGAACTAGSDWTAGWMVFFDDNRNDTPDVGETVLRYVDGREPLQVRTSSNIGARLVFRPDGRARTNAGALLQAQIAVCIATTRPPENQRNVAIDFGSRFNVVRVNGGGACAAPANT